MDLHRQTTYNVALTGARPCGATSLLSLLATGSTDMTASPLTPKPVLLAITAKLDQNNITNVSL